MKKLIFTIAIILVAFISQAQIKGETGKFTKYIVLQGDTIELETPSSDGQVISKVSGKWTNTVGSGYAGVDSMKYNLTTGYIRWYIGGSLADSMLIDGRYLLLSDTTDYVQYKDSLTTFTTPNQMSDSLTVIRNSMQTTQTVFQMTLPAATTVAGRIAGATLPPGWSIAASGADLIVTHSLTRRVFGVSVFAVTGTEEQQLFNTAAYNGIISTTTEIVKVQSLGTINKVLKIYIVFV